VPSLQIHIPISPTPSFFTMVHMFAESVRSFAGQFSDARIVVSVGEDIEPFDIDRARPELKPYRIDWRWTDRALFRRHSYFATGLDRWAAAFECDYVLMADADVLIVGPLDEVEDYLPTPRSIAGVIATKPPFTARGKGDDETRWPELYQAAGLTPPPFDFAIPGHGIHYPATGIAKGPAYYNFGFVIGRKEAMNAVGETFEEDYLVADKFMQSVLSAQAGLGLSIARHGLDAAALPLRYNFWSQDKYLSNFPAEAAEVRVLHYLNGPFKKHGDNDSVAKVEEWLRSRPNPSDSVEQLLVTKLTNVLDRIHMRAQSAAARK
jgi:lipopolysaccharide biosynthesis glycosyltransferase